MDLVFIDNASHGVNAVLRSLSQFLYTNTCRNNTDPAKVCKVLQFSTAYPMIPQVLDYINGNLNSPQDQLLTFNVSNAMLNDTDMFLSNLQTFIDEEYTRSNNTTLIHMAVISHITAFPAALLDIKRLCAEVLHPNGIISVIDSAHGLGQVRIDVADMDPDILIATGYKWMHAPRGSGLLYVRQSLQDLMEPTVTSNLGGGPTPFQSRFSYVGTKDYTPWIAMNYSLHWRQTVVTDGDDDAIMDYIHRLAFDGGRRVAEMWNTSLVLQNEARVAAMSNVVFITQNQSEADAINFQLLAGNPEYRVVSRIERDNDGVISVRLCAQIFMEMSDFESFGQAVLDIYHSL